jgi:hypothetical protein
MNRQGAAERTPRFGHGVAPKSGVLSAVPKLFWENGLVIDSIQKSEQKTCC